MTNYTQWKSLVDLHEYSAIPDSDLLQVLYDPRQEEFSDTNTVSTVTDFENDFDATTASEQEDATFETDVQNGEPAFAFNGDDSILTNTDFSISEPWELFAVIDVRELANNLSVFDGGSRNEARLNVRDENGGHEWSLTLGGDGTDQGGVVEEKISQISIRSDAANNDTHFRVDAGDTIIVDGASEGSDLSGITLGSGGDVDPGADSNLQHGLLAWWLYSGDPDTTAVESYMQDVWGPF